VTARQAEKAARMPDASASGLCVGDRAPPREVNVGGYGAFDIFF
jgi:hypothetical protein